MRIAFRKMHGAGNDFIVVDDRAETFPAHDTDWLRRISSRRTGVGCEGIILIQPSSEADLRMRFFNPDGAEVEMCGNGARCMARLACEIGAAGAGMRIETVAGVLGARVLAEQVRLQMTVPRDWRMGIELELDGESATVHHVNTGVPHAVIEIADLAACDVQRLGAALRYHEVYAPAGTNADFICVDAQQRVHVRTYERGVEAETMACGTGLVASALVAGKLGKTASPARVVAAGGDEMEVAFRLTDGGAEDVTLTGPAVSVFEGTLEY